MGTDHQKSPLVEEAAGRNEGVRTEEMEGMEYRSREYSMTYLRYHLVFCTRYCRKIFQDREIRERFAALVLKQCQGMDLILLNLECRESHASLYLDALPDLSPAEIVRQIKLATGKVLRQEFPQLARIPNLWTRKYLVSTKDPLPEADIQRYVEGQKKRY